jgi:hypothetical protein
MRTKLPSKHVPRPLTSDDLEERKHQASDLDRQIRATVQSIRQTKQSYIQILAKELGVPEELNTDRLIWYAVVQYANADIRDSAGLAEGIFAFDILLRLCVHRLSDSFDIEDPLADLSPFGDLQSDRASYEARVRSLHIEFRAMLAWLADPNGFPKELRQRAFQFLMQHGAKDALAFDAYPNDEFDETGNDGYPLFYWKMSFRYRSVLTPVATFILECIDKYQEGDLELNEAIPLILCRRPECRRFAVLLRKTRDFCGDSCRTLFRQKNKREDWADYMRKYRANNY